MKDGTTFFLQDVSDGKPLTDEHTLARLTVGMAADPAAREAEPRATRTGPTEPTEPAARPKPRIRRDWVRVVENAPAPRVLPEFRLMAVLGSWMEADVVGATVLNALTQGCAKVFLVDNASSDGTVEAAVAAGAVLARRFATERYEEDERVRLMLEVASEVSATEGATHIWWLFLDADEFPHGPHGLTLRDYLATLDEQFRIVGARYFDHYPSGELHYVPGRHPLDFQPLCEELSYPMCQAGHRKHPLVRYDRGGPAIQVGNGFHVAYSPIHLLEPAQPVFMHHFPYREEAVTRRRLHALWAKDADGRSRADEARDTHMLTRVRSLDAVYAGQWSEVHNFAPLDPMAAALSHVPARGVSPKPWTELAEPEHHNVLRWYSMVGAWQYERLAAPAYGDDTTYRKGIAFLDGHGDIEDWGCGPGRAREFISQSRYIGVDGSGSQADVMADLREYRSSVDCILMRHVLEHNTGWRDILANAVASFRRRMVIVVFTPFAERTHQIATSTVLTSIPVPDISFRREDLLDYFAGLEVTEETVATRSQYGVEHIFYVERPQAYAFPELERELDAWAEAGIAARFWLRDDDAVRDTPALRRLLELCDRHGVEPAVAVIPERADQSLVSALAGRAVVWQHGWAHKPHGKLGEFGAGRDVGAQVREALAGRERLDGLFGPDGWQRVFAPPYHLLWLPFKVLLRRLGYAGLSAGDPPMTPLLAGLPEVNIEVDVMDWPSRKGQAAERVERALVGYLSARRRGVRAAHVPIGLLGHHLAHDEQAWTVLGGLLELLRRHTAAELVPASEIFSAAAPVGLAADPAPPAVATVSAVITSCGRQDLLARTLESFVAHNTYPLREIVVVEDGPASANAELEERFREHGIRWLATGEQRGQIAAVDFAYGHAGGEYIFHCEDDWEFHAPGFIEKSLAVLRDDRDIVQVWLRALDDTNNHPLLDLESAADGVPYRLLAPGFRTDEWGTFHGFSFNPGLRRRADYEALGSFAALAGDEGRPAWEVEALASAFYLERGMLAAILADNSGRGYVRHIGWGRRVESAGAEQVAEAEDSVAPAADDGRPIIFTLCSNNYLGQALTLIRSIERHAPGFRVLLGLVDGRSPDVDYSAFAPAQVVTVDEVGLPDFDDWVSRFNTIIELNTTVKPSFFKYLRRTYPASTKVVYLDPDTRLYSGLAGLEALLDEHPIVVTPHVLQPIPVDGLIPQENVFLNYGLFNLGFIALRADSDVANRFLDWWEERCLKLGFSRLDDGLFVDQLWVTMAPLLFDGVLVLRDPGYNVAPWNVHERRLVGDDDGLLRLESGSPLVFYHFSGFRHSMPRRLSSDPYNRVRLEDRPDLGELYADYHRDLLANGVEKYSVIACRLLGPATRRAARRLDLDGPVAERTALRSTVPSLLARRDAVVNRALDQAAAGNLAAAADALRELEYEAIDDRTLNLTDPLLRRLAAGRRIVASLDPGRRPADHEVVIIYGHYPLGFTNVVVNNPIRRHLSHFWRFKHDEVEYDRRWDGVDRILVINADRRVDRWDSMLRDLASAGAPLHLLTRVSATMRRPDEPGDLGGHLACLRSHIEALRLAHDGPYGDVLILEDDFTFTADLEEHMADLAEFYRRGYDYWVCLLGTSKYGQLVPFDDLLDQSFQECTNAEAYLVSRRGRELILPLFEDSLRQLKETGDGMAFNADRCWSILQPAGKFFVFRRKFGFQGTSVSDITGAVSRYLD